ncbi:hypothetical protein [Roseibium sp.]|uniref:hypothetical protein n=1 Tax=Roseibium sp. TaxID=1936156 RepID=UPI001B2C8A41|nr:hypothetical protein [Roseibium sp.]MBO6858355.1 hypothetical protein [Roseibium sp.]
MNDNEELTPILPVSDGAILAAFQRYRKAVEIDPETVVELSGGEPSQLEIETEQ